MSKNYYITTTLPYVNDKPHIGHALEFTQADVLARVKKLQGYEVFFNTGTDEHGQKILEAANRENKNPKEFVDYYSEKFKSIVPLLNLCEDIHFIRTTDLNHIKAAQFFWQLCEKNGDIYKKNYKVRYCIGCELEKTDSELQEGKCPLHPKMDLEIREEENYFFRYSKYEKNLLQLYKIDSDFVFPRFRFNEIKQFVENGLNDFSISRPKSKMPWGIDVPNDPDHVMYVWFDALINYISTLGWPDQTPNFEKFWPGVQVAGKDQIRMQAGMWQAMLLSAGIPTSKQIFIHGFITSGGQKMSKSLGNVIDPVEIVNEYGTEALRYFLIREIHPYEDSDLTIERFKESYNANLANGIGNLTSRVMKMAETNLSKPVHISLGEDTAEYFSFFDSYSFNEAADYVWDKIGELDKMIQEKEPFKLVKENKSAGEKLISEMVLKLYSIARILGPILPETSEKIRKLIEDNKAPETPLFLRKE